MDRTEGKDCWDRLWRERRWLLVWAAALLSYGVFLMKGWLALSPFFFLVFLVLPALEDWRTGYNSDGWSILLALSGLMTAFWRQELSASLFSAAFVFMIYGALCLIAKESAGTGDMVLSTGAAFWLGPVSCLFFIWFSALAALLFLAPSLLLGRKGTGEKVRFGPFIAMGGVLAYGWQEIWGFPQAWIPFG